MTALPMGGGILTMLSVLNYESKIKNEKSALIRICLKFREKDPAMGGRGNND